ncbi:MAG: clan AA aspartic protease [Gammaproteobacteria bacterium]|nr:clan AA aspartic protease [Gammaproteobacteria bacterium]MBV9723783.1 clan AA aspartic protease [Gammaproteobacteria bacterium]
MTAEALICRCVQGAALTILCATAAAQEGAPAPASSSVPAPAAASPATPAPQALPTPAQQLEEVIVQTTEPRYVAPTRRDRIGRIWAPVLIDGKGPYRMVLDTGANRSAITTRAAQSLGGALAVSNTVVTGFTGTAVVPTLHVSSMEVGELLIGPADLPVLSDVFGGAQGVLGIEGLANKRIYADFSHDRLEITLSHGERALRDFVVVPLTQTSSGLLVANVRVGRVRAKAIIDTGAQGTIGNLALRHALMRVAPRNAATEEIIGVTLDVQTGDNLPAPDIDFGAMQVKGAHITFGDMYLFQHWKLTSEPCLTLGMDLLGSFDVLVIDYTRHELQIRSRRMPELPYSLLH